VSHGLAESAPHDKASKQSGQIASPQGAHSPVGPVQYQPYLHTSGRRAPPTSTIYRCSASPVCFFYGGGSGGLCSGGLTFTAPHRQEWKTTKRKEAEEEEMVVVMLCSPGPKQSHSLAS